jgi:hypothetical protein
VALFSVNGLGRQAQKNRTRLCSARLTMAAILGRSLLNRSVIPLARPVLS